MDRAGGQAGCRCFEVTEVVGREDRIDGASTGDGTVSASRLFSCFDFRLSSDIALGELTPADDPADARPIVSVRRGMVPETLPDATAPVQGLQVTGDSALLTVTGTARYLIRGGQEIIVDAVPGAAERNVRLFLLGSALGALVYQRGLLPLHANAVVIDGAAYAVTGPSGTGKSTLAAWFAQGGYPVLCDDVCVVSFDADGRPLAWPGLPRVKLWQDAADALGHSTVGLDRAVEGLEKFHVPIGLAARDPVPLAGLYTLDRADDGVAAIVPIGGAAAMGAVLTNSYRGEYVAPLGLTRAHFAQCATVARHAAIFAMTRPWGFDAFDREAAALAAHMAAVGRGA